MWILTPCPPTRRAAECCVTGSPQCSTSSTPDTSMPRAATSVATRTFSRPSVRNSFRAAERSSWGMSPCSGQQPSHVATLCNPICQSSRATAAASCLVFTKTMAFRGARVTRISAMTPTRACGCTGSTSCVTVGATASPLAVALARCSASAAAVAEALSFTRSIETMPGLQKSLAIECRAGVIVAQKSSAWAFCGAKASKYSISS
mmetsp:Transcript_84766/g.141313  ORF Transcript_84766/g.141313 Transcript_84766/m.141313 type:complete len:205 (-) Transcript_84766:1105-1719(-)